MQSDNGEKKNSGYVSDQGSKRWHRSLWKGMEITIWPH
jgi:hypothetical protein